MDKRVESTRLAAVHMHDVYMYRYDTYDNHMYNAMSYEACSVLHMANDKGSQSCGLIDFPLEGSIRLECNIAIEDICSP